MNCIILFALVASTVAKPQSTIVKKVVGHLLGDRVSQVTLTGKKTIDSPYISDITIEIDGRYKMRPPVNAGYNPQLKLYNFTEEKTEQIYLNIDSGGSGGYSFSYVYGFQGEKPQLIYDFEKESRKASYEGGFADNYMISVANRLHQTRYAWSIADTEPFYRDQIFDARGKVDSKEEVYIGDINSTFPLYNPSFARYELLTTRSVSAVAMVYHLADITNILTYEDGRFVSRYESCGIRS